MVRHTLIDWRSRAAGTPAALGAIALALVLSSCGGTPEPLLSTAYDASDPQTWAFDQVVDQALTDAANAHATAQQIGELEVAKANGSLSPEQLRSASEAVLACVRAAGASTSAMTDRDSLGLSWPSYTVTAPTGMTDEDFEPLYRDCEMKNRSFIVYVYGNQPAAREALGAALSEHEIELKQCLEDMGGRNIDDMTLNELWGALKDQSFGGQDYGYSQDKDCIIDAGINW